MPHRVPGGYQVMLQYGIYTDIVKNMKINTYISDKKFK